MVDVKLSQRDQDLMHLGYPPEDPSSVDAMTVGHKVWEDFVVEHYLAPGGYVADGFSQIKFVLGRAGSGKTHLLRRLVNRGIELGYVSVFVSATQLRLHTIDSFYAAIAKSVNMEELARRLAARVARELGYDLTDVPTGSTFLDWLVQHHNRIDTLVRRDAETILGRLFKRERIDPNFYLAFAQLASDILGTRPLDATERQLVYRWLAGEVLRSEELHRIHLARRIDRFNARDMLHALADFVCQQEYAGMLITIDEMEDLPLGRDQAGGRLRYGSSALADAYQSLRELVDDLPSVPGMLILLAGQNDFLELPRGIKSYDALWLRIQHEIVSPWFNRFAQVIDLDRALQVMLTMSDIEQLHRQLVSLGLPARPLNEEAFRQIVGATGGEGTYRRVLKVMLNDDR